MKQEKIPCRHHWIIDTAQGPMSKGVCQLWGVEREFENSPDRIPWVEQARQAHLKKLSTPPGL